MMLRGVIKVEKKGWGVQKGRFGRGLDPIVKFSLLLFFFYFEPFLSVEFNW